MTHTDIRIALPSKGALAEDSLALLAEAGLKVRRPNPRQYQATIPALPGVTVIFQRPGDIVVGVRQGSIDFGITGYDIVAEKGNINGDQPILLLHEALDYGHCSLNLAIPEDSPVQTMADLQMWAEELEGYGRALRIATKFPHTTAQFLQQHNIQPVKLIDAEGTLEIAPAIGYADLIADLVSSGITLRDNHLHPLNDGQILRSQAVLIANRATLQTNPEVRAVARTLLEYIEAHLRAQGSYLVIANVRGDSAQTIVKQMATRPTIFGLQGPTIAPVMSPPGSREQWFSVSIVVRKDNLVAAIADLRAIGGSGVIAAPLTYIFEEEPERYRAMLAALESGN
ncbi:MAG: ATP phosphoribosyltransferase [Anaerolineales bacterium]|nr:ATP phosphoribosyltransferase [Anaerolineales bacterium]MCB8991954.1 ATP phosphoribosyltransferase [Ardenticatenaceae bacterium]MCB9004764.1 ATP phosphoribosyltransferase [Ardenticatenaceae bacterium]